jgi:uncharacterized protein (TIGR02246 family)
MRVATCRTPSRNWLSMCGIGIGISLLAAACSQPITQPGVSPELKHSWEVAFNRGDAAAVANLYADDAQLIMPGSPPVRGKAAIRATIEEMVRSRAKVRIGADQNRGSGSLAYVSGPYSVFDHEGGRVTEAGSYVEVWSQHDGSWLIDLDVNAAGPVPAPATGR